MGRHWPPMYRLRGGARNQGPPFAALPVSFGPPTGAPPAAAFEPEAVALFAAMTTPPTDARKALINACIVALKDSGVWDKLDTLQMLAAADSQAALLNWKDPATFTAVPQNAPTFTVDRGYAGNGSTSYLKTGFNPTTAPSPKYVQNSAHISLTDRTARAAADTVQIGAYVPSVIFMAELGTRLSGDVYVGRLNTGTAQAVANTSSDGRFLSSRTASNSTQAYRNGTTLGAAANGVSSAPVSLEFYVCGMNNNGAGLAFPSDDQIAQYSIGGALNSTEAAAFDAAIAAYLTGVGA